MTKLLPMDGSDRDAQRDVERDVERVGERDREPALGFQLDSSGSCSDQGERGERRKGW